MTRTLLLAATVLASLPALSDRATAQPVTGFYVGGAGGGNFLMQETPQTLKTGPSTGYFVNTHVPFNSGYVGLGSVGFGFGNGLRLELEGDYRYNSFSRPRGFASAVFKGHEEKYGGMANVLFDLDVGSPYVYPYIGGGLGYADVEQRQVVAGPGVTQRLSGSDGSFAYQAIAGFSFPIPPVVGLSLTTEYRFFALAGDRTYNLATTTPAGTSVGRLTTTDNYNHSLLVGLRYAFNVAPPPVAAVPAPAAAVAQDARTYLVFFDWDRADLTDRARQIIAQAAEATTRTQVTRIEVTGNTDTTGTAQYNLGLSQRRAQNVAAELVRLGVPRAAITTSGVGFSQLLVPTGPGVREPQNRRVQIVLR